MNPKRTFVYTDHIFVFGYGCSLLRSFTVVYKILNMEKSSILKINRLRV